ncbi:MAG TPA: hypothetical protein VK004_05145 [Ignavibacteria bacterium]|nr:hypothetical protein [Ignavibacteria bacterium]
MKKYLSILTIFALAFLITACTEKNEQSRENTVDDTEETSEGTSNETSGSESGETSGNTDNFDPVYGLNVIPSGFRGYKGKPVEAASWTDSNGDNLVIITESGSSSDAELYGYHFIMDGNSGEELWKIQDFVKDCEFDLRLNYVPESLSITDLDGDGIGESTFLYNMSCKSDVSPDDLKLMMHENDNKYALRGYTYISSVDAGGDYKVDPAFNNAPAEFKDYAIQMWQRHKRFEY